MMRRADLGEKTIAYVESRKFCCKEVGRRSSVR